MNPDWQAIEQQLKNKHVRDNARSATDFWSEFRSRASGRSRNETVLGPYPLLVLRWPVAACAAILVCLLALRFIPQVGGRAKANEIISFEIAESYGAVLIMKDAQTESTILWIDEMEYGNS